MTMIEQDRPATASPSSMAGPPAGPAESEGEEITTRSMPMMLPSPLSSLEQDRPANYEPTPTQGTLAGPAVLARVHAWGLATAPLLSLSATLDGVEGIRIQTGQRIGALQRSGDAGPGEIEALTATHDALHAVERDVVRRLQKAMRDHPLAEWVGSVPGLGLKQSARLLACVINPYWHDQQQRPRRGPAELWAYCGFHVLDGAGHEALDARQRSAGAVDPPCPPGQLCRDAHTSLAGGAAPRRRKGQKANWNGLARSRARLVAESCMKQTGNGSGGRSPYRDVYDRSRTKNEGRCASDGHGHNRALRETAKAILRDLYLEAKRWHEETP